MFWLRYISTFLFVSSCLLAHAKEVPISIDQDFSRYLLEDKVEIFKSDKPLYSGEITSLNYSELKAPYFNLGHVEQHLYFKIPLHTESSCPEALLLEIVHPYLSKLEVSLYRNGVLQNRDELGAGFPFLQRAGIALQPDRPHRNFQVQFDVIPDTDYTLYVHIPPSRYPLNFKMYLWEKDYRMTWQQRFEDYILTSFFLLSIIYLFLLGAAIYITRFHYFWYYFLYALLGALVVFTDLGLSFRYFWPKAIYWQQIALLVLVNLHLIFGTLFVRQHFNTKTHYFRTDIALRTVIITSSLLLPIAVLTPIMPIGLAHLFSRFQNLLIVGLILIFFILLFRARKMKGDKLPLLFLIGFSIHGLSLLKSGLQDVGILELGSTARLFMNWGIPMAFYTQVTFMLGVLVEMGIVFYIAIRRFKGLFDRYQQESEAQASNMNQLLLGIEGERSRIASELHDGLGARLSSIKMRLQMLPKNGRQTEDLIHIVDEAHREMRHIAHDLMPPSLQRLGFDSAVKDLLHQIETSHPELCINYFSNFPLQGAKELAQLHLYRIVQELLNNVLKHARATEVHLQLLRHEDQLLLSMEDNGVGLPSEKDRNSGQGLQNIDRRVKALGGRFELESRTNKGTVTSIEIPALELFSEKTDEHPTL